MYVPGLQGVNERNPGEVAEAQHESKTIGGDVHSGENRLFHVHSVPHVEALQQGDQQHGHGDRSLPGGS